MVIAKAIQRTPKLVALVGVLAVVFIQQWIGMLAFT
jgi:hypothetical protein